MKLVTLTSLVKKPFFAQVLYRFLLRLCLGLGVGLGDIKYPDIKTTEVLIDVLTNILCDKLQVFLYCTLLDYRFPSDVSDREHGIKYVTGGKKEIH